jgi:hypothetical protein
MDTQAADTEDVAAPFLCFGAESEPSESKPV